MSQRAAAPRIPTSLRLLRAWYAVLSTVAPERAEESLVDRFFTPRRRAASAPSPTFDAVFRRREVRSGRHRIAVYEAGEGTPVLLAHGWEGSAADLAEIGVELAGAGFRVVALDMPAHGRSDGRRTSLPVMARALHDVAAEYGPLAGIVAHSLGGGAALLALRQGLAAERAVLLAPPREPGFFMRRLAEAVGYPLDRVEGLRRRAYARVGVTDDEVDAVANARSLRLPGLVFHGIDDREVPFEHGREIAGAWPGARLVPLRGLGHRRLLRAPGVLESITAFLASECPAVDALEERVEVETVR